MALADVKNPLVFFFFSLLLLCSFELTGVAGNSIRTSEEEEKGLLKDPQWTDDLLVLRSDQQ